MDIETNNLPVETNGEIDKKSGKNTLLSLSILASAVIIAGAWIYTAGLKYEAGDVSAQLLSESGDSRGAIEELVLPTDGIALPVRWGDFGAKMVNAGVIDSEKFEALYSGRGADAEELNKLLYGEDNGNLKINSENSGLLLNLLWAFGLANKNSILEEGPMTDPSYGGADRFASTGGWTLAKGSAMDHYSRYDFIKLTEDQQKLVERVANGIYRPCCGNSTYFPDCNHGMAMLGLLELMAAQGASEEEMYRVALQVNSYWFPDTYLAIATYLKSKGIGWNEADPKELLGSNFSSASGFQRILQEIETVAPSSGSGCGVDAGIQTKKPSGGGGCGV
ncbi:MAG: hypothetical protein Q8P49_01720 [Candidatus Liptonbacteria bacterium]|nr:hypothetical protein [Candidatus Liptonbacteria bacterium]